MGKEDVGCADNTAEAEAAAAEEIYEALPDLGQRLGIRPRAFRMYLDRYSDLLPVCEVGEERALTGYSVSLLERIHRRTQEGFSEEEIRSELARETEPVTEDDTDDDRGDPAGSRAREAEEQLMEVLHDLQARLERSEEKRVEDRDKLMMMLMRTQRELQQMRYELARTPRRQRHRSFWDRILGR